MRDRILGPRLRPRYWLAVLVVCTLVTSACARDQAGPAPGDPVQALPAQPPSVPPPTAAAVVPGDIIIRPDADTDTAQREVSAGMTLGHTWATAPGGSTTITLTGSGGTPVTQTITGAIPHGVRVDGVTVRMITSDSTSGLTFLISELRCIGPLPAKMFLR